MRHSSLWSIALVSLSPLLPEQKVKFHRYISLKVLTVTDTHTAAEWYDRDGWAMGEQSSQLGVDEGIIIIGTHWDCYALDSFPKQMMSANWCYCYWEKKGYYTTLHLRIWVWDKIPRNPAFQCKVEWNSHQNQAEVRCRELAQTVWADIASATSSMWGFQNF